MSLKNKFIDASYQVLMYNAAVRNVFIKYRYRDERVLDAIGPDPISEHPSVIHFTLHKCASVFVSQILEVLARNSKMRYARLPAYFNHSGQPKFQDKLKDEPASLTRFFHNKGYVYAALRHPHAAPYINDLNDYKIILILRDPIDNLISTYYSFGKTHREPLHPKHREKFSNFRENISKRTVDQYVLDECAVWKERYNNYIENIHQRPNVCFLKFEDMVTDFDNWMNQLVNFVELDADRSVLATVERKFREKSKPLQNRRDRLQPKTLEQLNEHYADILSALNYAPAEIVAR